MLLPAHFFTASGVTERGSTMSEGRKQLRFAALVRVSTEKQERQGESLRVQRADCQAAVAALGGRVVAWYGADAAEHATEGWERKELTRLLGDAKAGRF